MSRAVRTARGAFGALAATLLAAASHGLAGGSATPLAVIATVVLALPLCVLLAGRVGSLWRLSLAVVPSQFVYHWSFAGLGAAPLSSEQGWGSAHSAHFASSEMASLAPGIAANGAADAWMWAAHALAAVLTIALMHRGERAAMHLVRVLRSTLPVRLPTAVRLPQRGAILACLTVDAPRVQRPFLSTISHRGPPAAPASAI